MTMNTLRTAARSNNALVDALRDQMNKRIVGQETFIDSLLLGLFVMDIFCSKAHRALPRQRPSTPWRSLSKASRAVSSLPRTCFPAT